MKITLKIVAAIGLLHLTSSCAGTFKESKTSESNLPKKTAVEIASSDYQTEQQSGDIDVLVPPSAVKPGVEAFIRETHSKREEITSRALEELVALANLEGSPQVTFQRVAHDPKDVTYKLMLSSTTTAAPEQYYLHFTVDQFSETVECTFTMADNKVRPLDVQDPDPAYDRLRNLKPRFYDALVSLMEDYSYSAASTYKTSEWRRAVIDYLRNATLHAVYENLKTYLLIPSVTKDELSAGYFAIPVKAYGELIGSGFGEVTLEGLNAKNLELMFADESRTALLSYKDGDESIIIRIPGPKGLGLTK